MRRTLGTKVAFGFVIALTIIIVGAAVAFRGTQAFMEHSRWVEHTLQVLTKIEAVNASFKEAHRAQRGYIITGDERFLNPYQSAISDTDDYLSELKTLSADNPRQQERLTQLGAAISDMQNFMDQTIKVRKEQGFEAARVIVSSGRGEDRMKLIAQLIEEMNDEEAALLQARSDVARASGRHAMWGLVVLALLVFVILGAAFLEIYRDLRARRLAESRVRESKRLLSQLLEATPVGIFVMRADGKTFFANLLAQKILGHGISPGATLEQLEDFYQVYIADTEEIYPPDRMPVVRALQGDKLMVEDMEIRRPDATVPLQVWAAPIFDSDGRVAYSLAAFIDITERKRTEELLRELSLTDDLTGLRNRRGFMLVAEQQLAYGKRVGESLLVYLDLDGLKQINDNYGHEEGSAAIIKTAEIMRQTFRTSDIMARFGGDEFVVLAVGVASGPETLIARLQSKLEKYNEQSGLPYQLRVSVGVESIDPQSNATLEELLACADQQMYEQKRKNKERLATTNVYNSAEDL